MLAPGTDLNSALAQRGVTRRQLVKFCSAILATLAMPERYLAQTVEAVGKARKPVLVWLQFQDCTGCSESMLRSSHPDVADVVLDLLSWEYHEVIMAGAGSAANRALDRMVNEEKGKYLVVVEGAIPTAEDGVTAPSAAIRRSKLPKACAATQPRQLQLVPALSMAGLFAPNPIPRALSACMKRCRASRSSICRVVPTTPPTPRRCWSTT